LGDLSERAKACLLEADLVAAEDTRRANKLLLYLGSSACLTRIDDHVPEARLDEALDAVEAGKLVVYVSDAGVPGISDPGARLVDRAYARGLTVDSVPGPSAVTNALALSGFYAQRFAFFGFLPRKRSKLEALAAPYRDTTFALVFFDRPERLERTLEVFESVLGSRRVAVCREMTKVHQEVRRGWLSEREGLCSGLRGELTVVIEGKTDG
jgi:16S rRNA (cytidine1402-2'-O)-methyltransferase